MSDTPGYQLPKPHRKKLRRMRALLEAASAGESDEAGVVPTEVEVAKAIAFLDEHAACVQFMLNGAGPDGVLIPRCATKRVPKGATGKRGGSRQSRRARRAAEFQERMLKNDKEESEAFWRETRGALGLKGSSALRKSGSPKGGGREVSGGLPTLGKRR